MSEAVLTIENVNRLYDDGDHQVEALQKVLFYFMFIKD